MPQTNYEYKTTGGDAVTRQFDEIANAAKRTQQAIERSSRASQQSLDLLNKSVQTLQGTVQGIASQLGGPLARGLSVLSEAGPIGLAVAGITAIAGVTGIATLKAAQYADELLDTSDALGINVERYQQLIFAGRTLGVSQENIQQGLTRFAKTVGDAERGQGRFVKALSIAQPELLKMLAGTGDTTEKLDAFLATLSKVPDQAQRVSLLVNALGPQFAKFAGTLHDGAGGLADLSREAQASGNVLSGSLLRRSAELSDEWDKLSGTLKNELIANLLELAPHMLTIVELTERWLKVSRELREQQGLAPQLTTLGQQAAESPAGKRLAELEAELDAAIKRRQEASAAGPLGAAFVAGGRTPDEITAEILGIQKVRDNYVEQQTAAERAGKAAQEAAQKGMLSVEDYNRVLQKLKPQVDQIWETAKADVDKVNAAVAAGKQGIIGAPTIAQGEAAKLRIWADAQKKVDELTRSAVDAHKELARGLKETGDATDVLTDKTKQLSEGVLPKELDLTKAVNAEAEKRKEHLIDLAEKTGLTGDALKALVDQINASVEAWRKATIAEKEAAAGAERNAKAQKDAEEQLKRSEKLTQDLRQAVAESAAPLDSQADAVAKVNKKWDDYLERIHGTTHALGEAVPAVVGMDEALVAQGRANDLARLHAEELNKTLESVFGRLSDTVDQFFTQLTSGTEKGADAFKALEKSLEQSLIQIGLDLVKSGIKDWLTGGGTGTSTGGGNLLSGFLGLFSGGGGSTAAAPAVAGATGETASTQAVTAGAQKAASSLSSLAGELTAFASIAVSLGLALRSSVSDAAAIKQATLGTGQAPSNVLKGLSVGGAVAGVGIGAGVGAGIGSVVPGIGTAIGAGVGAAVGAALSTAISQAVSKSTVAGINEGVKKGVSQAKLEETVTSKLQHNLVLNILSLYIGNFIASALAGGFLTPDINRIFGKMLRQILGAEGGGFSTAGIPVGSTSQFGLGAFAGTAGRTGRIIAESIGAGGEAFAGERREQFISLLLGAAKQRIKETGEDAAKILGEELATAFGGSFLEALRTVFKMGIERRTQNVQFVAGQFTKAANLYGLNLQVQGAAIEREGNVPGTRAIKASQEAVGKAFSAALADGAQSDAFRKSLAGSVQDAFIAGASKALTSGPFGQYFASLFSISNAPGSRRRRRFRRAKRRGDTGAELQILSEEFQSDVSDFAKLVSDPAFARAIQDFNDQLLRLRVNAALAAGDIHGAADAIEATLAPAIQLVKDIAEEAASLRSRAAIAGAEPGFQAQAANVQALTRRRQDVEQQFTAQFGASLADFGRLIRGDFPKDWTAFLQKGLVAADVALRDPTKLFPALKEFAEARMDELEAELDLLRQLRDTFKQAQQAFDALHDQAQQALGTYDSAARAQEKVAKAQKAAADITAAGGGEFARGLVQHPEMIADLTAALSDAMSAVTERLQFFQQAIDQSTELVNQANVARGGADAQARILDDILRRLPSELSQALGTGPGDETATSKALQDLSTAIQSESQRLQFFQQAATTFQGIADQADIARRGRRGAREQLADTRGQIEALLPRALAGSINAFDQLQRLLPQATQLAGQGLTGGRLRQFERYIQQIAETLAHSATAQATTADKQLELLGKNAEALRLSADGKTEAARKQLLALDGLAKTAGIAAGAGLSLTDLAILTVEGDLHQFVQDMAPVLDYLGDQAAENMHNDFNRIATLLGEGQGPDSPIYKVLTEVRNSLPQGRASGGPVTAGESYIVGERRAEFFTPAQSGVISNTPPVSTSHSFNVTITVNPPPSISLAQASEYGRSIADPVQRQVVATLNRMKTLKKVA